MRALSLPLALTLALAAGSAADADPKRETAVSAPPGPSVLDFTLDRIDGTAQPLANYRGKVLLLVNVASRCGLTPQYEQLQAVQKRYAARGFSILAFPANDFAGQEPGSNREIAKFCKASYGISFPLFAKIHVKGEEIHPLYARITGAPAPIGGEVEWNFQKFLVDRRGRVVERIAPRTLPDDPAVLARIEALLAEDI